VGFKNKNLDRETVNVARGSVVILVPDPYEKSVGKEQQGKRPSVIVSVTSLGNSLRFDYDVMAVVPLTRTLGLGDFYPVLSPRPGLRLLSQSSVIPEQLRVVDKDRVEGLLGRVTGAEMSEIEDRLRKWLNLPAVPPAAPVSPAPPNP